MDEKEVESAIERARVDNEGGRYEEIEERPFAPSPLRPVVVQEGEGTRIP